MDKDYQIWESKTRIFQRDGYTCRVCGKSIYTYGTPQLAHLIAQSEMYLKKFGKDVIYNDHNMISTCCLKCNHGASLGKKTKIVDDLAKKIKMIIDNQSIK